MDSDRQTLEELIYYLNQIQNKEQTLKELLDELINKRINNAQMVTQNLIEQEINQNILFLMGLRKKSNILKKLEV